MKVLFVCVCFLAQSLAQNLELPRLPYEYDGLEPHVDEETMRVHHLGHHAAYLATVNNVLSMLRSNETTKPLAKMGIDKLLQNLDQVPTEHVTPLRNGGGGFVNHFLFWKCMSPNGTRFEMDDVFGKAVTAQFGSIQALLQEFREKATKLFGSGWTWLVLEHSTKRLYITTTPNQDTPAMQVGHIPILGLDLWEHAYYLKHQNKRAEYISSFFNVIDWKATAARYEEALKQPKTEL
mmetsp:Transcript_7642/g.25916  ORF Transcript_7642/g.25916 Transcript_7642/m.25916 type:complete len:236 (-) Transcript_7642:178-885(-)